MSCWPLGTRIDGPMRTTDPTARVMAVRRLDHADELLGAVEDPSPDVARAALRRLVELHACSACEVLRPLLWRCDLSIARDVVAALRELGDRFVRDDARQALRAPAYAHRLVAVWSVAALGDETAMPELARLLHDPVSGVRAAAAETLVRLRPDEVSARACAQHLTDDQADVRQRAVRAIGRCACPIAGFLALAVRDDNHLVRREAAMIASRLSEHDATALFRDRDVQVRIAACRSASRREARQLGDALAGDRDPEVRLAAAHTLGGLRLDGASDVLVAALSDPAPVVRAAALRALLDTLRRGRLLSRLCTELDHADPVRRRAALYALQHLEAGELAEYALRLQLDPHPDVRLALIHAAPALGLNAPTQLRSLLQDPDAGVRSAMERVIQLQPTNRAGA